MNWNAIENRWNRIKQGMKDGWCQINARLGRTEKPDPHPGATQSRLERLFGPPTPSHPVTRHSTVASTILRRLSLLGLGAGLMYYFDPDRGRRRRALVRDRTVHLQHRMNSVVDATLHDLTNRVRGLWAGMRSLPVRIAGERVPDEVVVARVRAKMGRYVSHPHPIAVTADRGHVTLVGPILGQEVESLLSAVARIPGVRDVRSRLEVHREPADWPELQGGRPRTGEVPELCQVNLSPTARLALGAVGTTLVGLGTRRKGLEGLVLGSLGATLLIRGFASGHRGRGRNPFDHPAPWRGRTIATGAPILDVALPFRSRDSEFPEVGL